MAQKVWHFLRHPTRHAFLAQESEAVHYAIPGFKLYHAFNFKLSRSMLRWLDADQIRGAVIS